MSVDAPGSEVVTEDAARTEAKLRSMLKKELQDIASELEIQTRGTKEDILHRLMHCYHKDRRCHFTTCLSHWRCAVCLGKGVFLQGLLDRQQRSDGPKCKKWNWQTFLF